MIHSNGALRISRLLAVDSLHAGIDAARTGASMSVCPFSINGPLEERFAAHWWLKGWFHARVEAQHGHE